MGNNNSSDDKKGGFEEEVSSGKFLNSIHKTDNDFKLENGKIYIKDKNISGFVAFYAPWCHFCTELAPTWNEYAKEMGNSSFRFLAVDCTSDETKEVVKNLDINGFPTIKFIEPKTGEITTTNYKDGSRLDRTKDGLKRFLKEKKIL